MSTMKVTTTPHRPHGSGTVILARAPISHWKAQSPLDQYSFSKKKTCCFLRFFVLGGVRACPLVGVGCLIGVLAKSMCRLAWTADAKPPPVAPDTRTIIYQLHCIASWICCQWLRSPAGCIGYGTYCMDILSNSVLRHHTHTRL